MRRLPAGEVTHHTERGPGDGIVRSRGAGGIAEGRFRPASRRTRYGANLITGAAVSLDHLAERHGSALDAPRWSRGYGPAWRVSGVAIKRGNARAFLIHRTAAGVERATRIGPGGLGRSRCPRRRADKAALASYRGRRKLPNNLTGNGRDVGPFSDGIIAGCRAIAEIDVPGVVYEGDDTALLDVV